MLNVGRLTSDRYGSQTNAIYVVLMISVAHFYTLLLHMHNINVLFCNPPSIRHKHQGWFVSRVQEVRPGNSSDGTWDWGRQSWHCVFQKVITKKFNPFRTCSCLLWQEWTKIWSLCKTQLGHQHVIIRGASDRNIRRPSDKCKCQFKRVYDDCGRLFTLGSEYWFKCTRVCTSPQSKTHNSIRALQYPPFCWKERPLYPNETH